MYDLYCYRNTISKGSSSGITLLNVKGHSSGAHKTISLPNTDIEAQHVFQKCVGDPMRVRLIDNYVIDTFQGYGMLLDASSCIMDLNQLKKNHLGGLLVTTTSTTMAQQSRSPLRHQRNNGSRPAKTTQHKDQGKLVQKCPNNGQYSKGEVRTGVMVDDPVDGYDTARSFDQDDASVQQKDSHRHQDKMMMFAPELPCVRPSRNSQHKITSGLGTASSYDQVAASGSANMHRLAMLKQFSVIVLDNSTALQN